MPIRSPLHKATWWMGGWLSLMVVIAVAGREALRHMTVFQLMELRSLANDDGNHRDVQLVRKGDRLVGAYDGKKRDLPGDLIPTTLWNSDAVDDSSVLETVKGRERTTQVTAAGVEQLTLPIGTVQAKHYVFTGQFSREVWYDDAGVLVASQMEAKDGSIIRQELLRMP